MNALHAIPSANPPAPPSAARSRRFAWRRIASLFAWFIAIPLAAAVPLRALSSNANPSASTSPGLVGKPGASSEDREITWATALPEALAQASSQSRPVFVFFTSPASVWCKKMKIDSLPEATVQAELRRFIPVEIDVVGDPATAARYQVSALPRLMVLSPQGDVVATAEGYQPPVQLGRWLHDAIGASAPTGATASLQDLVKQTQAPQLDAAFWPAAFAAAGQPGWRPVLWPLLLARSPFPRADVVACLSSPRLVVRLGAMELLEEISGESFGFDPWLDRPGVDEENRVALKSWEAWAGDTKPLPPRAAAGAKLTDEEAATLLNELVSGAPDRVARARSTLRQRTADWRAVFQNYRQARGAGLEAEAASRLHETEYELLLGSTPKAAETAHLLVRGNLDTRLQALTSLGPIGPAALPILRDFIADPDAITRETSIDALAIVRGPKISEDLKPLLATEQDANVLHAVVRALAKTPLSKALPLLTVYLADPREDMAVEAWETVARCPRNDAGMEDDDDDSSIVKEPTPAALSDLVRASLTDPRWRVRVAALNAAGAAKLVGLSPEVTKLLNDPDEFVRVTAVKALANFGLKDAQGALVEAFVRDNALRAVVVEAFQQLEIPMPPIFAEKLIAGDPETALAVLDTFDSRLTRAKDFVLVEGLALSKNPDISSAAMRLLGKLSTSKPEARTLLARTLRTAPNPDLQLAVLESLAMLRREPYLAMPESDGAETAEAPPPPAATPGEVTARSAMRSFRQARKSPVTGAGSIAEAEDDLPQNQLGAVVLRLAAHSPNAEVRFQAMVMATRQGDGRFVSALAKESPHRSAEERVLIATALEGCDSPAAPALVTELLQDKEPDVRRAAAESALSDDNACTPLALCALRELSRPGAAFTVGELPHYYWSSRLEKGGPAIAAALQTILATTQDPAVRNFALMGLRFAWIPAASPLVEGMTHADDPLTRRAAWFTFGMREPEKFVARAMEVARDPAAQVRAVLPSLFHDGSNRWVDWFDSERSLNYSSRPKETSLPVLTPELEKEMRAMTRDVDPSVRWDALLAAFARREKIDADLLIESLRSVPEPDSALYTLRDAIGYNEKVETIEGLLGKEGTAKMLAALSASPSGASIVARWKTNSKNDLATKTAAEASAANAGGKTIPGFVIAGQTGTKSAAAPHANAPEGTANPGPIATAKNLPPMAGATALPETSSAVPTVVKPLVKLVFFASPGCQDCERVEAMLAQLKKAMPDLDVQQMTIRSTSAMRLNEALAERFRVPEQDRLVTPAVVGAGGFLVKHDLTWESISRLVTESAQSPAAATDWAALSGETLQAADESIGQRYAGMTAGVVIAAGALDGINPCAFATIIFFLSYLQLARRSPLEITQVGAAFVLGVFLAYFVLGLGLVEIVARLQGLRMVAKVLNWTLAGFALVVMVLSIRDGIRCLQGRLQDISLQLPEFLKVKIRASIRQGAKARHFIAAAFVTGIIISFLELACTGQVYAPTVLFMLKSGEGTAGALGYLLLYNVAFVVPLIVIFLLAAYGMRSAALIAWLHRHAAGVKFATAALFFVLFVLLVLGEQLPDAASWFKS